MAVVVGLFAAALFVSGCGSSDSSSSTSSDGGSSTTSSGGGEGGADIAFLAGVVDATYTPAQVSGLEQGSGGKIQTFNPEFDPNKQLEQCQDAITSQRYDAIVITPLTNTSQIPCAKEAAAANIPLVVDATALGPEPNEIEPQEEGVVGSMLYIPKTLAEYTWEGIENACEGVDGCEAVIEFSFTGDPLYEEVIKYAEEKEKGSGIKVVATYESQFDPAQTTVKLRDILVAHPGTNVVTFANDPTALAGVKVIKDAGMSDQTKVIGDGSTANGIKSIEAGEMYATIGNYPQTTSKIEGEMARQAVNGEEVAPSGDAWQVGPIKGLVTKENVGGFKPEW